VLFADEAGAPDVTSHEGVACGFYWTEGVRGLGWAVAPWVGAKAGELAPSIGWC
jgi:hypothetical protein